MTELKTLFFNTIQKEYRSKTLVFLLILSFLLLSVLNMNSSNLDIIGEKLKFKIIYSIVDIWSFILAVILGVDCIGSDRNNNVLLQIMALPVNRWQYLLARIVGTWLIVILYYTATIVAACLMFSEDMESVGNIFGFAFLINSLIIMAVIVISILYSFFLPKIFSVICTFITYIFTYSAKYYFPVDFLWEDVFSDLGIMKLIGFFFYIFIPHLSSLNDIADQLTLDVDLTFNVAWELIHFFCSFLVLFFMGTWILKKKH